MSPRWVTASACVYRQLLVLYSPDLRARFGDEMIAVFTESCRDADVAGGILAVIAVWLDVARDLAVSSALDRARWARRTTSCWWPLVRTRPATAAKHFVLTTLVVFVIGKIILPGHTNSGEPAGPGARWLLATVVCTTLTLWLVLRCFMWLEPLLRTSPSVSDQAKMRRKRSPIR